MLQCLRLNLDALRAQIEALPYLEPPVGLCSRRQPLASLGQIVAGLTP